MPSLDKSIFILGGAGLVGTQIAYQVARSLKPQKIVIASLFQKEVRELSRELGREVPNEEAADRWVADYAKDFAELYA